MFGRLRFPAEYTITSCPGLAEFDPFTGIPDGTRRVCAELVAVEWRAGHSGVPYECPGEWCGFAGVLIRQPVPWEAVFPAMWATLRARSAVAHG